MHAVSLSTSVSLAGQPGVENSAVTNPASSLSDAMQVQASRQLLLEEAWDYRRSHDSACKTTVRIVQCTVELRLAPWRKLSCTTVQDAMAGHPPLQTASSCAAPLRSWLPAHSGRR